MKTDTRKKIRIPDDLYTLLETEADKQGIQLTPYAVMLLRKAVQDV